MKFDRLTAWSALVGNTPLAELHASIDGTRVRVFAKMEYYAPTGSIKDRMAYYILRRATETGALRPDAPICEGTSGNTGIAFAALGALLGHPVVIFMPEWMSDERKRLLSSFGATLKLVTAEEGGFAGCVEKTLAFQEENPDAFLPNQFDNDDNVRAHEISTGPELLATLASEGLVPDAFIAGVGTGGTIMGVGRALRKANPGVKLFPLEPSQAPVLSTGIEGGQHRIEGIGDGFIPSIVKPEQLDKPVVVSDCAAIATAQLLARHGLGVGISSGANFLGAVLTAAEMGGDAVVTTVFPDDNKKYLTTDLLKPCPPKSECPVPSIRIESIRTIACTPVPFE